MESSSTRWTSNGILESDSTLRIVTCCRIQTEPAIRMADVHPAISKYFRVLEQSSQELTTRCYVLDGPATPGLVAKYKDVPQAPFRILDNRYEETICCGSERTTREFRKWLLQARTRFATVPILVSENDLTLEWFFLRNKSTVDLLLAVKYHLKEQGSFFVLSRAAGRLQVQCLDQVTRELRGLAIPTTDLLQCCPHLHFADLPNPSQVTWKFLSDFGVLVSPTTAARLQELQALREVAVGNISPEDVHDIYRALDARSGLDKDEIL